MIYKNYLKRIFDFTFALLASLLLAPLLAFLALLVLATLGRPVLFKHERPGYKERIFTLYKFRTLTQETDENGELLPDPLRTTRLGNFLRSTSLDELPELFNVLRGDMSLVGPRPLLIKHLAVYTPLQSTRHDVRPGLTGLAQINGRNENSLAEKVAYDLEYIEKMSFSFDLSILVKTVLVVLKREGINPTKERP